MPEPHGQGSLRPIFFEIRVFLDLTLFNLELIRSDQENNKVKKVRSNKTIISKKIGRNDPCPCGSGKKYKICHGS